MQMTQRSAELVLATHGPRYVSGDDATPWEDERVLCLCGDNHWTREEFATHQAANLALVAEVVQETVAEPVIRCSCGHRKERHAGGYMGCSRPLCLCMEFRR